jgi:hypothetical protein
MIKDWFNDNYFDPFEGEWAGRSNKYAYDPNYSAMTLEDFITENKLNDDKNFRHYAAKHHIVPWHSDGYDTNKLNLLLNTYRNIAEQEAKLDAKKALESDNPTGITNPADIISSVKVTDVDNDGDDDVVVKEGSYW